MSDVTPNHDENATRKLIADLRHEVRAWRTVAIVLATILAFCVVAAMGLAFWQTVETEQRYRRAREENQRLMEGIQETRRRIDAIIREGEQQEKE